MTDPLDRSTAQPERECAVSERAYATWDEGGQPEGEHLEHYEDRGAATAPDQRSGRVRTEAPRARRYRRPCSARRQRKGDLPSSQAGLAPATRQLQGKA